jgi:hypothetical protein
MRDVACLPRALGAFGFALYLTAAVGCIDSGTPDDKTSTSTPTPAEAQPKPKKPLPPLGKECESLNKCCAMNINPNAVADCYKVVNATNEKACKDQWLDFCLGF